MGALDDAKKLLRSDNLDVRMYRNGHDPKTQGPAPAGNIEGRSFTRLAKRGLLGIGLLTIAACSSTDYNPNRLTASHNHVNHSGLIQESVAAAQDVDKNMHIVIMDMSSLYTPRSPEVIVEELKREKANRHQPIDEARLDERIAELGNMGAMSLDYTHEDGTQGTLKLEDFTKNLRVNALSANASSITFSIDSHSHDHDHDHPVGGEHLTEAQQKSVCIVTAYRQTASAEIMVQQLAGAYLETHNSLSSKEAQTFVVEHEIGHCLDKQVHGQLAADKKNTGEAFADSYGLLRTLQKNPDSDIVNIIRDTRLAGLVARGDTVHFAPPAFYEKVSEVAAALHESGELQNLMSGDIKEISEALAYGRESEKFAHLDLNKMTLDKDQIAALDTAIAEVEKAKMVYDPATGLIDQTAHEDKIAALSPNAQNLITAHNSAVGRLQGLDKGLAPPSHDEALERYNAMLDETLALQGNNPNQHLATYAHHIHHLRESVSLVRSASYKNPTIQGREARAAYMDNFTKTPGPDGLSIEDKWVVLHERTQQTIEYIERGDTRMAELGHTPQHDHTR